MKFRFLFICVAILSGGVSQLAAQTYAHGRSSTYQYPREKEVMEKLETWQDQKFGILIHWGLYSELGIVESWSICSEEEQWIPRDSTVAYDTYKRDYWATIDRFNPVNFDPESWAAAAKEAGMRYVVFTTKHHDGFNMFDTKQTDFSIMHGAFKGHARSNVAREIFQAFREQDFMIGAYFSKPDWHCQYYWWDRYATPTRHHNYTISKNPWRWEMFKQFTYNQIEELMNGDYGKIDILWLDGGWVRGPRPGEQVTAERLAKGLPTIDMARIATMARRYQPGLLVVDRTVPGEFENYQTPERGIPDIQLTNPWESCITLGNDWGYVPTDRFKTPQKVIHMLVEIVAKGGNLLLGVGPKPDGTLSEEVTSRLQKIGEWTRKNGEAIYNTRITPVYREGNTWFTQSKAGDKIYAIVCLEEGMPLPKTVSWSGNEPPAGAEMIWVETGQPVRWKKRGDRIEVTLPRGLSKDQAAVAFAFDR